MSFLGIKKKELTHVVIEYDTGETLWIPKELVNVVVADDLVVISFPANEFAIEGLITLITHELVERLDDCFKVEALLDWLHAILALWTAIIIVGTLENEAKAFWDEADVAGLAPTEKIKGDLAKTVVLAHVVHGVAPAVESAVEVLRASSFDSATLDAPETLEAGVLRLTDSIVEIELCGEIPLAIVCMLAANVVCMEGEEGLVWTHAGSSRVELLHEEIKLGGGEE